ncbi:hypothetical protein ACFZB9_20575 [Kitasatospora sp. NPDC008050]|uniref:hypothetical protein n=1 Tax=Kitasatospora sp. NPDC008050 TaxID=3364021 RepID=UPI0036E81912
MRSLPRPRTREGAAVSAVLALAVLEAVGLAAASDGERAVVGIGVVGAGLAVLLMTGVLLATRRRPDAGRRVDPLPVVTEVEDWYPADTLAGFPLEAVRPYLAAYPLGRLHTGWVLAVHGHEAGWIAQHLDVSRAVAAVLVAAAAEVRG